MLKTVNIECYGKKIAEESNCSDISRQKTNTFINLSGASIISSSILLSSSTLLFTPICVWATTDPKAQEALQLLSGYESHSPTWILWLVLANTVYFLSFGLWKKILAAW